MWFLGLADKWVRQASLSCLHKGKESRNQWAVFTGYTADCNTARYVTHSQAVKTDELLGRAQPGRACAKSRRRQQWHIGQEQLLAPRSSETEQEGSEKAWCGVFLWSRLRHLSNKKAHKERFLKKRQCTYVKSTQMDPLHNLFPRESGLSVYTSLWSFLLGKNRKQIQFNVSTRQTADMQMF